MMDKNGGPDEFQRNLNLLRPKITFLSTKTHVIWMNQFPVVNSDTDTFIRKTIGVSWENIDYFNRIVKRRLRFVSQKSDAEVFYFELFIF